MMGRYYAHAEAIDRVLEKSILLLAVIIHAFEAATGGSRGQATDEVDHSVQHRLLNEVCLELKAVHEKGSQLVNKLTRHLFGRLLSAVSRLRWSVNISRPQACKSLGLVAQQVYLSNQVTSCQHLVALLCTLQAPAAVRQLHDHVKFLFQTPELKSSKTRDALNELQQALQLLAYAEDGEADASENPANEGAEQPRRVPDGDRPSFRPSQFAESYTVAEKAAAMAEDGMGRFTRAMHLLAVCSKTTEQQVWQRLMDIAAGQLPDTNSTPDSKSTRQTWGDLSEFHSCVESNKAMCVDELLELKRCMATRAARKHPEVGELSLEALADTDGTIYVILADRLFTPDVTSMDDLADAIADQHKGVIGGALICPILGVPFTPTGDLQPLRLPCNMTISRKAWQANKYAGDRRADSADCAPVDPVTSTCASKCTRCPTCEEEFSAAAKPCEDSWIQQRVHTVGFMYAPHIDPQFLLCGETACTELDGVVLKRGELHGLPVMVNEVDLGARSSEEEFDYDAHTHVRSLIATARFGSLLSSHVLDPIATCVVESGASRKVCIVYHSCEGLLTMDGCLAALERGKFGGKRVAQLPAADLAQLGLEITDAMIGLHDELKVPALLFSELVFVPHKGPSGAPKLSSRLMVVSQMNPARIKAKQGSINRKVQSKSVARREEGRQLGFWLKQALGRLTRSLPERYHRINSFIARLIHGQPMPLKGIRASLQAILREFAAVGAWPRLMQPNHRLLDVACKTRKFAPECPPTGSSIVRKDTGLFDGTEDASDEDGCYASHYVANEDVHLDTSSSAVDQESTQGSYTQVQHYSRTVNEFMQRAIQLGSFHSHPQKARAGPAGIINTPTLASQIESQGQMPPTIDDHVDLAREVNAIAALQLPTPQASLCPLQAIMDFRVQKVVTRLQCFAQLIQDRLQRRRAAADVDKETEELISVAEMVYLDHQIGAIQTLLATVNLAYIAQRARPRDVLKPALIHLELYLEAVASPGITTDSTIEACKQLHAALRCLYDAAEDPIGGELLYRALFAVREVQALCRETRRPEASWLHELQRMLADVYDHPELAALCDFQAQVQDKVQQLRDGRVPGFHRLTHQLITTAFDTMPEEHQRAYGLDLLPGVDSWLGSEESVLCVLMDRELCFPVPLNTEHLAESIVKGIRCGRVVAGCPILGLPFVKRPRNSPGTSGLDPGQLPCCGCMASRSAFDLNQALGVCQVCGELMRPEDGVQAHLFSQAEVTPLAHWASFHRITPALKGRAIVSPKAPQHSSAAEDLTERDAARGTLPTLALNVKGAALSSSSLCKCWQAVDAACTAGRYSPFVREPLAIQQEGDQRRVVWCATSGPSMSDLLMVADFSALDIVELGLQFMDALHAIHEHALSRQSSICRKDVMFQRDAAGRHWLLLQPSFDAAFEAVGGAQQVKANDIRMVGELLWECLQRCNMSAQCLTGEVVRAQACRALLWMLVSNMRAGAVLKRKYVERVLLHLWQELILLECKKAKLIGPVTGHESLAARLVLMRRGNKGRSSMWWDAKVSSKKDLDPDKALADDAHLKPVLCLLHHSLNVHDNSIELTNGLGIVLLSTRLENIGLLFNLCGIKPTSKQPARDHMFRVQTGLQSSGRWALEACAIGDHAMTARPRGLKNVCLSLPADVDLVLDGIPGLILQNVSIGGDLSPIPNQPGGAGDPTHPRICLKGATESAHLENVHIAGCLLAVEHARVVARGLSLEGAANQLIGLDMDAQATVDLSDVHISGCLQPLRQQRDRSTMRVADRAAGVPGSPPDGPEACTNEAEAPPDNDKDDDDNDKLACAEVSQLAQFTNVDLCDCRVLARSNASLEMQNCRSLCAGAAGSAVSTQTGARVTLKQVKVASRCTAVTIGDKSRAHLEDCDLITLKPTSSRDASGGLAETTEPVAGPSADISSSAPVSAMPSLSQSSALPSAQPSELDNGEEVPEAAGEQAGEVGGASGVELAPAADTDLTASPEKQSSDGASIGTGADAIPSFPSAITPAEASLVDDVSAAVRMRRHMRSTATCVALMCSAGAAMHVLATAVVAALQPYFQRVARLRLPWHGPHALDVMEDVAQQLGVNMPACVSVEAGWEELMEATRGTRVLLVLENVLWPREIEWLVEAGMECWATGSCVVAATRGVEGDWGTWEVVKCGTGSRAAVLGQQNQGPGLRITSAILAGRLEQLHDDGAYVSGVDCCAGSDTIMRATTVVAHHGDAVSSSGTLNAHLCSFQATARVFGWVHDNLYVCSGSQASLTDCKLNGGGAGLRVEDEGSLARLTGCELLNNDNTGAIIQKAGAAELHRCIIRDTVKFQGLHARHEGTRVLLAGCCVSRNNDAGLYVELAATVRLLRCFLCASKSFNGVCVRGDGSRLDAKSCVLADNCQTGAWIRQGATALFMRCKFSGPKCCHGVQACDPATRVVLHVCRVCDISDAGVWVHNGACTRMIQTIVCRSKMSQGARVHDPGSVLDCWSSKIMDNFLAGVFVRNGANALLHRCIVSGTVQGPGVQAISPGTDLQLTGCVLKHHNGHGILLQQRSSARLRGCSVVGCAEQGMLVEHANTFVVASHCSFKGNRLSGVRGTGGAQLSLEDCKMVNSLVFCGLDLGEEGTEARLDRCEFDDNVVAGAHVHSKAHAALTSCWFTEEGHCVAVVGEGTSAEARNCTIVYSVGSSVLAYQSDVVLHGCREQLAINRRTQDLGRDARVAAATTSLLQGMAQGQDLRGRNLSNSNIIEH